VRRRTVKAGVRLIIGGIVAVILATFCHDQVAALFMFSPGGETRFIYLGLFWGGLFGFCGILVTIIGFLRASGAGGKESLFPIIMLLFLAVLLFFTLLWISFQSPEEHPRLRPGETITI
jgi:hypothetical protein